MNRIKPPTDSADDPKIVIASSADERSTDRELHADQRDRADEQLALVLPATTRQTMLFNLACWRGASMRHRVAAGDEDGIASGLRQTDCILFILALARVTFARISEAFAVQMNGFG
jgi:hypothetical protein